MRISDSLGNWESVGEVTVSTNWQLFPEEILNGENFRFTYILDWDEWARELDLRAYIIARFYYATGNAVNVSPTFKLFPKEFPELRSYPYPEKYRELGSILRSIGLKGVRLNRRFYFSNVPIINMKLKCEYLL
jgi:hypothetical protein